MIKTHASLFSGIGGAEIAASWMGWDNVFHCEIQEFPRKVLEYWYPNAVSYEDITKTDFTSWRGKIDILTGGFPCQAFSMAGKRLGDKDHRYLWPEMLRAIREIQPSWVVGENVTGLLSMVQSGEEAKMGRTDDIFEKNIIYRKEQRFTLDEICDGLERAGYAVQPFVVPACAVGAPHRRDRVWIVARLAADTGCDRQRHGQGEQEPIAECERTSDDRNGCKNGLVADTLRTGRQELDVAAEPREALLADSEGDTGGLTPHPDVERLESGAESGRRNKDTPLGGDVLGAAVGLGGEQLAAYADEYGHPPRQACERTESGGQDKVPLTGERTIGSQRPDGLPRLQRTAAHAKGQQGERPGLEQRSPCQSGQGELGGGGREDCYELPADRWRDFPTQSPVCRGDDGISTRLAGITFPRWRAEAIKALGNAWCVPVAYEIFRAIAQVENEKQQDT